ncbi:mCG144857, partial [Mus musculus]
WESLSTKGMPSHQFQSCYFQKGLKPVLQRGGGGHAVGYLELLALCRMPGHQRLEALAVPCQEKLCGGSSVVNSGYREPVCAKSRTRSCQILNTNLKTSQTSSSRGVSKS